MTVCVFGWEERARESSIFMREEIARHTGGWSPSGTTHDAIR
jgi:myo-inositol catabolism protein IolH